MNWCEKASLVRVHIEDMEQRLGAYLVLDGCEKSDVYAQTLIRAITMWHNELAAIMNQQPVVLGDGGDDG